MGVGSRFWPPPVKHADFAQRILSGEYDDTYGPPPDRKANGDEGEEFPLVRCAASSPPVGAQTGLSLA